MTENDTTTTTTCAGCGWQICRNQAGGWFHPHSVYPSTLCADGIHFHIPVDKAERR